MSTLAHIEDVRNKLLHSLWMSLNLTSPLHTRLHGPAPGSMFASPMQYYRRFLPEMLTDIESDSRMVDQSGSSTADLWAGFVTANDMCDDGDIGASQAVPLLGRAPSNNKSMYFKIINDLLLLVLVLIPAYDDKTWLLYRHRWLPTKRLDSCAAANLERLVRIVGPMGGKIDIEGAPYRLEAQHIIGCLGMLGADRSTGRCQ
ncbi:hypothetical protein WOLCODRAFT_19681 [Wolfiporia cocos MD-104 SS10]|uniref:Uncharacterized protein n=1 Tax=Wolfiporia cocos (strain MD-104) TaxID=742152 RepID=A0A2H3IZ09_WOLCO|nr:hypothetical protein WOLCODRAFT_19681 [Wolfiporia cocos MD-104 SS10]